MTIRTATHRPRNRMVTKCHYRRMDMFISLQSIAALTCLVAVMFSIFVVMVINSKAVDDSAKPRHLIIEVPVEEEDDSVSLPVRTISYPLPTATYVSYNMPLDTYEEVPLEEIEEPVEPVEVMQEEVVQEEEEETEPEPEPEPVFDTTHQEILYAHLGEDVIDTGKGVLTRFELPSYYYPGIDFSSFQSWMPYDVITDRTSAAYKVIHNDRFYVDKNGLCRYWTYSESEFTIDRHDDYVIALGTYYKPKGTCGSRWLIVTTNGAFTCVTGDEKSDNDTDEHHMFTGGSEGYCGLLEYLVDTRILDSAIKRSGTVTKGPVEVLQGEILYIYRID